MTIELITPDNPSPLLGSVVVRTLGQAMREADALMRHNPDMQGIVLHYPDSGSPKNSFNWASLNTDRGMESFSLAGGLIKGQWLKFDYRDETVNLTSDAHKTAKYGVAGFEWSDPVVNPSSLDPVRTQQLDQLRSMFGMVTGRIQHEDNNAIRPHFDSGNAKEEMYRDEQALFYGRVVHWLQSRQGGGVVVPHGHEDVAFTEKPVSWDGGKTFSQIRSISFVQNARLRQVRDGDALIFFDDSWGPVRSLAHSSPDFKADIQGQQRVLDNFQFGGGKPLKNLIG